MEHKQLLNFLSVCKEKSFSKAADYCFVSQQGLSVSIKQLEDELGVPLFIRTSTGVILTEFGNTLKNDVESFVAEHDKIIEKIRHLKEKSIFHISLGILNEMDTLLPPYFFKTFLDQNKNIIFDIMFADDEKIEKIIVDYNLHVGFSLAPVNKTLFDAFPYFKHKIYAVTGKEHPLARCSSIKMGELKDEQIAIINKHRSVIDLCYRHEIRPDIYLTRPNLDLIYQLCTASNTVCLCANPTDGFPDLVRIDIKDVELYAEVYFIVNKNVYIGDAAKRFIEYTKEVITNNGLVQ
jgi:DNA-binding transcriptional LysR family regulator